MPLSIRIISSPNGETISEWNKQFPEDGGEVGRAYGSTMQLSDASREVSGTHAMIKKSSRGYQVIDNSTNGLFINGATQPLGKGNQSTLNDGDVLDIGQYRLLVSCFVPEQASANRDGATKPLGQPPGALGQIAPDSGSGFPFSDDPFATEASPATGGAAPQPVYERQASFQPQPSFESQTGFDRPSAAASSTAGAAFSIADYQVQDDDPFVSEPEQIAKQASPQFNPGKDFSDDPFEGEESVFPSFFADSSDFDPVVKDSTSVAEYLTPEEHQQHCVEKAMEMALTRLLDELSPTSMESMFDDLVSPGFFSRKPKYWEMYQRYFQRQMTNRDWHIKFSAYFQESYRMLKMGEK